MEDKVSGLTPLNPLPVLDDELEKYPVTFVSLDKQPIIPSEYERVRAATVLSQNKPEGDKDCLVCAICLCSGDMVEEKAEENKDEIALTVLAKEKQEMLGPNDESKSYSLLYKKMAYPITEEGGFGPPCHVPCISGWINKFIESSPTEIPNPHKGKSPLSIDEFKYVKFVSTIEILRHHEQSQLKYPTIYSSSDNKPVLSNSSGSSTSSVESSSGSSSSSTTNSIKSSKSPECQRAWTARFQKLPNSLTEPLLTPENPGINNGYTPPPPS